MNDAQHSIRKFTLELQLPGAQNAYSLERRCSEIIKEKLVNGLDNLLSAYFDGPGVMKIQRIELDLGSITVNDLENVFTEKCLHELSEKFKTIGLQNTGGEILDKAIDKKHYVIDQLIYFLGTGQLPSFGVFPSIDEWEKEILAAIKEAHEYFNVQLLEVFMLNGQVVKRLFFQFDKDFVEELFYACNSSARKRITELILHDPLVIEKYIIHSHSTLIKEILNAYEPAFSDKAAELLLLLQKMDSASTSSPGRERMLGLLFSMINKMPGEKIITLINDIKEALIKPGAEMESLLKQLEQDGKQFQKKKTADVKEEVNNKIEKESTTETAVFIQNAGLVIFHPYLITLFESTGLVHDKNFIDDESRCRAVHLLQYMVDGQEQLPEYVMSLNKILCGMPAEMHIDRFIVLTQQEKDEANELMQAVIGYWTILKNTSVPGLQETFLQRKGKLSFMEEDRFWKLQVEKSALDVLLDKLPWGFSYIQLPWMEHKLITEWR